MVKKRQKSTKKEKRLFKRIVMGLRATIISGEASCEGVIDNISKHGICVITFPTNTSIDFAPGTALDVTFQFLSEESLRMRCRVKWSYKTPPHGLTYTIGMEIKDPPWNISD